MSLGEMIGRLRKGRGLDQAGLAKTTGLSVGSIRNWEQDRSEPGAQALLKLAVALEVPVEELIRELGRTAAKKRAPSRPRRPPRRKK
jgi:transcriptional regulator with XRE-family HTH domain